MKRERWHPPAYGIRDVRAVQAVHDYAHGLQDNPPNAQDCKRLLDWIIETAAGTYDETFQPGSADITAYLQGRRSVGLALIKLIKVRPEIAND